MKHQTYIKPELLSLSILESHTLLVNSVQVRMDSATEVENNTEWGSKDNVSSPDVWED